MSEETADQPGESGGKLSTGKDHIEETVAEVVDVAEETADKVGRISAEVGTKAEVAVVYLASRTAGAALAVKLSIESAIDSATNSVQAAAEIISWIIEHVEHLSIIDEEAGSNYHRIRAVGDASEFLQKQLDNIGLEEYDLRIEASIDTEPGADDSVIIEIYKPTEEGKKPAAAEKLPTAQSG